MARDYARAQGFEDRSLLSPSPQSQAHQYDFDAQPSSGSATTRISG